MVAEGLARPVVLGELSSAKLLAFHSRKAVTIAVALAGSMVTPAGLVSFQPPSSPPLLGVLDQRVRVAGRA